MDKLFLVIPAYNEEMNIGAVIDEWYPIVEKYHGDGQSRLLVIDDGSTDGTYQIMQKYAKGRPYLLAVTKENGGHGATVRYGYEYAVQQGADYIFQTDSDGQTLPEEFDQFWQLRKKYDCIIGNRTKRQDGWTRVMVTRVLKLVIRVCFKEAIPDANTPYRLMNGKKLKDVLPLVPKDYNLSNVLLSVIFAKKHWNVCYVPITFRPRQGGVNSINLRKITRIGEHAVKDFITLNRQISK